MQARTEVVVPASFAAGLTFEPPAPGAPTGSIFGMVRAAAAPSRPARSAAAAARPAWPTPKGACGDAHACLSCCQRGRRLNAHGRRALHMRTCAGMLTRGEGAGEAEQTVQGCCWRVQRSGTRARASRRSRTGWPSSTARARSRAARRRRTCGRRRAARRARRSAARARRSCRRGRRWRRCRAARWTCRSCPGTNPESPGASPDAPGQILARLGQALARLGQGLTRLGRTLACRYSCFPGAMPFNSWLGPGCGRTSS